MLDTLMRHEVVASSTEPLADGSYRAFLRRTPAFRKLWLAQLISQTGDRASVVALLGLALSLTESAFIAGAILAASMLAPLAVFPIVSLVADHFDRKRLMIVADILAATMALSMILVGSAGTVWIGVGAVFSIATMEAVSRPAAHAALPNLVDDDDLGRANALLASTQGITLGIGPIIGGVVAALLSHDAVFVGNTASFLLSAALVASIARRFAQGHADEARSPSRERLLEGIVYVRSNPQVGTLVSIKSTFALAGGGAFVVLPVFAFEVFDAGELGIGLLTAARGLGALVGPFAARTIIGGSQPRLFATIGACAALFGGAYIAFSATPLIWLALPLVTLAHTGGFALWAMEVYGLQRLTPDRLRGRILTIDFTLTRALMGASMLATGYLVTVANPRGVIAAEALALMICVVAWTLITHGFWRGSFCRRSNNGRPGGTETL